MCVLCLFNFFAYLFKERGAAIFQKVEYKLETLVSLIVWIGDVGPVGVMAQELSEAIYLELRLTIGCKAKQRLVVVVVHSNDHVETFEVLFTYLA